VTVEVLMLPLRPFLAVNALVGIAFGVVLVAMPAPLLHLYGIPGGAGAELFARLLGAELLGLNVPTWMVRVRPDGEGAAFAVVGHAFSQTLGFAVSLGAAIARVGNAMLWSVVFLYAAFSAANLYFIFSRRVQVR
jgi:hypothetical protein